MAGLYLHIPFCKKACHYCNFHFSTALQTRDEMIKAMALELQQRANYLSEKTLQSVYFGGGTPSLLSLAQLQFLFDEIQKYFSIAPDAEITLEANPDDLTKERIAELKQLPINRLSIGIQSFADEELKWMNRAHTSQQSTDAVKIAQDAGFSNISIDLIYGIPISSHQQWEENLQKGLALDVNHISSYCLTVEEKTALAHQIKIGKQPATNDEFAQAQFLMLQKTLEAANFEQYEISNFARNKKYAVHNTSYWQHESYLGIGPSAHSYNIVSRSWNVANNQVYMKQILNGETALETEILTRENQFNEYLMTGLRTQWGCNLNYLKNNFPDLFPQIQNELSNKKELGLIEQYEQQIKLSKQARFFADGIASDLFV